MQSSDIILGLDFGTDSVRALLVTCEGEVLSSAKEVYPRWAKQLYCDPARSQYRQHPQDYLDAMTAAVHTALSTLPAGAGARVRAIGVDTTGSTPVAVNSGGVPLALLPEFSDEPDAMFFLWKDHTAIEEAEALNAHDAQWVTRHGRTYLKYVGGAYSPEWFWAKLLYVLRHNPRVGEEAHSWVEHSDWIPFVLCGGVQAKDIRRGRCAAGHKALWHPEWEGLPPDTYWAAWDERLAGWRDRLFQQTLTSNHSVGTISTHWAEHLGINPEAIVSAGMLDAHCGAIGAGIKPGTLVRIMGTSTCDILVAPPDQLPTEAIPGIAGQIPGSVIPGMIGLEAGQAAYGDVYAWFGRLLSWPLQVLSQQDSTSSLVKTELASLQESLLSHLSEKATQLKWEEHAPLALDWFNGRRSPDVNPRLKAALTGLSLGTDAPQLFRSLVEATAFGSRAIYDRFVEYGLSINAIRGVGGVAQKSPLAMQILADTLNAPIEIVKDVENCALGAAMSAATAAGFFPTLTAAIEQMSPEITHTYWPDPQQVSILARRYQRYKKLGAWEELFLER